MGPVRARPGAVRDPLVDRRGRRDLPARALALAEPHLRCRLGAWFSRRSTSTRPAGHRRGQPHAVDRDHARGGDLPDRRAPPPRPAPRTDRRPLSPASALRPLVGLQPARPRKPPSLLEPPPARLPPPRRRARRAEDLRRARPPTHRPPLRSLARLPPSTTTAPGSQAEIAPIQTELRALLEEASPKTPRNQYHRGFANNLLKIWPALWTFVTDRRRRADQQRRRTLTPRHRSSTANSPTAPAATTANASPNARSRPPSPAACSTARCSPTSPNCSPPTPAATRSPPSPEAPGTERLPTSRVICRHFVPDRVRS